MCCRLALLADQSNLYKQCGAVLYVPLKMSILLMYIKICLQTPDGRKAVPLAVVGSGLGGDCAPKAANFRSGCSRNIYAQAAKATQATHSPHLHFDSNALTTYQLTVISQSKLCLIAVSVAILDAMCICTGCFMMLAQRRLGWSQCSRLAIFSFWISNPACSAQCVHRAGSPTILYGKSVR